MEKAILAVAFILISCAAFLSGLVIAGAALHLAGILDGYTAWIPFAIGGVMVGNFWSNAAEI